MIKEKEEKASSLYDENSKIPAKADNKKKDWFGILLTIIFTGFFNIYHQCIPKEMIQFLLDYNMIEEFEYTIEDYKIN